MTRRIWALTIWLPRSLPSRNINVGTPFTGAITARRVNTNCAVERENFANTSPVDIAVSSKLMIDSTTTSRFAAVDSGNIAPYPIVPIVCTLKKNASRNDDGAACPTPPTACLLYTSDAADERSSVDLGGR